MVKSYVSKIQELERELVRLQHLNSMKRQRFPDSLDTEDEVLPLANLSDLSSISEAKDMQGKLEIH